MSATATTAASAVPAEMRAIVCEAKGADFKVTTRPVPTAGEGQVLIKVEACGVCGGDHAIKDGAVPGGIWPRIPGHEVVGVVVALGPNAKRVKVGDRVGRGWAGGYCFECKPCRNGNFVACQKHITTGLNQDGGWAEYMVAPWESLAKVPASLAIDQAGPLMCAGVTVYNSIRNAGLKAGAWLAVQGIGGLGHLAVQFANKMGYRVIVLSTSADKEKFARELGAQEYVDTSSGDVVASLMKITGGYGVELIVSTTPSGKAMQSVINALGPNGKLLTLGAGSDPITVFAGQLIGNNRCIQGWASGSSNDSEETLEFAAAFGIKVLTETFPLEKAAEVYDAMNANKIRFRGVLVMDKKQ